MVRHGAKILALVVLRLGDCSELQLGNHEKSRVVYTLAIKCGAEDILPKRESPFGLISAPYIEPHTNGKQGSICILCFFWGIRLPLTLKQEP